MTIIKSAAILTLLLVAGCGGPDKVACDPRLSSAAYASREKPPPGFNAPDFVPGPCSADELKAVEKTSKPVRSVDVPDPNNSPAVAGR
jgi:hypothetical protein